MTIWFNFLSVSPIRRISIKGVPTPRQHLTRNRIKPVKKSLMSNKSAKYVRFICKKNESRRMPPTCFQPDFRSYCYGHSNGSDRVRTALTTIILYSGRTAASMTECRRLRPNSDLGTRSASKRSIGLIWELCWYVIGSSWIRVGNCVDTLKEPRSAAGLVHIWISIPNNKAYHYNPVIIYAKTP